MVMTDRRPPRRHGIEGMRQLARSHTREAVAALVDVVKNARRHPAARVLAARELLDRGWSKAVQPLGADGDGMISIAVWRAQMQDAARAFELSMLGATPEQGALPAETLTPRDAIFELLAEPPPPTDESDG
jgi:hypothetical protein